MKPILNMLPIRQTEDKRILVSQDRSAGCEEARELYISRACLFRSEISLTDYRKKLKPQFSLLEADEAGPSPSEVSLRYGLSPQKVVMLSRNENPYGPSPRAVAALRDAALHLHRYPDARPFVEAVAEYTGSPEEMVVVGAGMDEIIITMARLFLGPGDRAVIPVPTYTYYSLAARLCGAIPVYFRRLSSFEVDLHLPEGEMIFLCSPNNPTGNAASEETVRSVLEASDSIVFLDEAYVEFAKANLAHLLEDYQNLVVGRTLSKAFGLAGLRLGYALAGVGLAEQYRRASPIFSISSISLAAGTAALRDRDYLRECVRKIKSERERMARQIEGASPSQANFLYLRTRDRSTRVAEQLLQRGVVVRDCASFQGAGDHHIRVTVGTPEENEILIEALASLDSESGSIRKDDLIDFS
jgi:histidinol-phosphate aminotransferase